MKMPKLNPTFIFLFLIDHKQRIRDDSNCDITRMDVAYPDDSTSYHGNAPQKGNPTAVST